ncbi:hypothetical protein [Sphingorhabdus sp.]|jgi:hypothetical protein|uniref:hypothetical protein n=1 Tax=Sphingorhabdus sp. TaxID=1902408 RepID=UPI0037C7D1E9
MTEEVVINIAISKNIEKKEGLSAGGIYDRWGTGPLNYIVCSGKADDAGDIYLENVLILEESDVVFYSARDKLERSDQSEPEDEWSLLTTLIKHLNLEVTFGDDRFFEIADFIENLSISVEPHSALNHLKLENSHAIGETEIEGLGPHTCYVSRYFAVNHGEPLETNDPQVFYEQAVNGLDYDEYDSIDVQVIIR